MANGVKNTFSGFFSQLIVVCLLAVFIVLVLIALYTTSAVANEMAWIGMTVEPLGTETAVALGIPNNVNGVIVGEVEGMAARAGIRHGDVVQRINGKPVGDMAGFAELTKRTELSKGGVQIVVNRRGIQMPVFVYPSAGAAPGLGQMAPGAGDPALAPGARRGIDRRWLGIEAETLNAGEARGLGIPAGVAGVLVDTVTRGGKAQQAGLANNDVIVSVNGQRTDSTARLWDILGILETGDPVELSVYRNGQLKFIPLATTSASLAGGMGGVLFCANCGTKVVQQQAVAGNTVPCPTCGRQMVRTQ